MDLLRGISIILVTFNHAILFTADNSVPVPHTLDVLNEVFAPVRMPLMVFLSGLLVAPSLARGAKAYLRGKFRRVLWPYLAWSVIVLGAVYASQIRNGDDIRWSDLSRLLYDPLAHLWFLYDLFAFYMIALLTKSISPLWISGCALMMATLTSDYDVRRFFVLLVFFMAGSWASSYRDQWQRLLDSRLATMVAAAGGGCVVVAALLGGGLRYEAWAVPLVAAGIALAIMAARPVAVADVARPVRYIGQNSLIFYLTHWYATSFGVQLAARWDNGWATVLFGTLAGIFGSALLCFVARAVAPVNWLFEAPNNHQRSSTQASERAE